jgi:HAD superfamily hydrolase (TIGR01509 family)
MNKKYCILDMDGTVVDSMPYWNSLSPDYLAMRGIPRTDEMDRIMTTIKTMTMPEACAFLKEKFGLPETVEDLRRDLSDVMRRHYEEDIPLKKGVREYLNALHAEGKELCILTATAPPLVRTCLDRLGVSSLFSMIMSCEEVGCGKDFPEPFLEAARRMGAQPSEIAVFEDSATALRTAKRAGFYTVAVYDRFTEDWDECVRAADEVILDWTQEEASLAR